MTCQGSVSLAYLYESIVSQLGAGQRRRGPEEAGVCHLLDRLSDRQDQRGVNERHDDVRIKLICNHKQDSYSVTLVVAHGRCKMKKKWFVFLLAMQYEARVIPLRHKTGVDFHHLVMTWEA